MLPLRRYYGNVARKIWVDGFDWGRDQLLIGLVLAVFSTSLQWRDGDFSRALSAWTIFLHAILPYFVLGALYIVSILIRGPWKVHRGLLEELSKSREENRRVENDLIKKLTASEQERERMEREIGPNLLMELVTPKLDFEIIRLINEGDQSAINIVLEESPDEQIKVQAIPWSVPFIQAQAAENLKAHFYQEIAPNSTHGRAIRDFLATDSELLPLSVRFENSKGMKFRRRFILRRELFQEEVSCFPEPREILQELPVRF